MKNKWLKLLALCLLCSFSLSLVACKPKVVLQSVDIRQEHQEIRSKNDQDKDEDKDADKDKQDKKDKNKDKDKDESKEPPKPTYDFSKEFKSGIRTNISRNAQSYPVTENSPELDGLKILIDDFLKSKGLNGRSDNISIVYEDLNAGLRYSYNPDTRYVAASVIKTAMGMVVAQLTDEGVFPADMTITYVPGEQFAADDLDQSMVGQQVSIWSLVDNAIINSANAPTSAIFEYFKREGRDLHFFMDERTGTNYAGDITMSAREGIGLVQQLYRDGRYPSYQRIRDDMTASGWASFLKGGIPVAVSSKYGNVASFNHEIGIAWTNQPFAYAVFTNGVPAYDILPELGTLLYNYNIGAISAPVRGSDGSTGQSPDQADRSDQTTGQYAPTAPQNTTVEIVP